MSARDGLRVAVVGAGPGGIGLAERLAANAPDLAGGRPLEIVLVDPHPPSGRVWRRDQPALLWMNSTAREVTMFTDDTVRMDGPVRPGPTIVEWSARRAVPLRPDDFPTRRDQADYLAWCYERIAASAPEAVTVRAVRARAVALAEDGGRQLLRLRPGPDGGTAGTIAADAVVLVQGSLFSEPTGAERRLADEARDRGLVYVPPHYAADTAALARIPPGETAVLRGMGLTFVDDVVLMTEGRGGRYVENGARLDYVASGREPVLYAGSRRGVPYLPRITYDRAGAVRPAPRHLTAEALDELYRRVGPLGVGRDVWPLAVRELQHFYYHRLFEAHPERTTMPWPEFVARLDSAADATGRDAKGDAAGGVVKALVADAVPDPADRLDVARLLDPLAAADGLDEPGLQAWARDYLLRAVRRHTDPAFSADLALMDALLLTLGTLLDLAARRRLAPRAHGRELFAWFQGVFSYCTSGPPPRRTRELEALSRAGILRFLGSELRVEAREDGFEASSRQRTAALRAKVLIESRQPAPDVRHARDPLLRDLMGRGQASEETLAGDDGDGGGGSGVGGGRPLPLGRLAVRGHRLVDAAGRAHPRRFALGAWVGSGVLMAGFNRPRANGSSFRTADALARDVLTEISR